MLLNELKKKRTILSFVLSFVLLALFFYYSDPKSILSKTREARLAPLVIALLLHYFSYLPRGFRWKRIFCKFGLKASSRDLAIITLILQSVDCIIPAKIGDIYGAQLMKLNYHLSRTISLGSIVLWRLLDALVVLLLCGVAALLHFGTTIPSLIVSLFHWWMLFLIVAALLGFLIWYLYKSHWFSRHLPESIRVLLEAFGNGVKPELKNLPLLFAVTVLIWLLEASRFYYICQAMDLPAGFLTALIVTTGSAMATAVPFTPSGLGAVEIFMMTLMLFLGFPDDPVTYTVILLDRAVSYWSQIPIGMLTMWISGFSGLKLWAQSGKIQTKTVAAD